MLNQLTPDENAINRVLAVDISSGFIWGELYEQVMSWIERINEYGITKWILYLSALEYEDQQNQTNEREIDVERVRQELKRREGKDVSIEKIREVLVRLSGGDLLEYSGLGIHFGRLMIPFCLSFSKHGDGSTWKGRANLMCKAT